MAREPRRFAVGPGASVSGVLTRPSTSARDAVLVLAHGAGGTMTAPLLVAFCDRLADHGITTVRFNFPYAERGHRAPNRTPELEACYRQVLAAVRADRTVPSQRLLAGGKSMGGRIASHLAAAGEPLDGLLFLGYPLHPAGRPAQLRAEHLSRIAVPMLFLAGTRDPLSRLDLLRDVTDHLPTATVHLIEDGDHSFHVRRRSGRDADAVLGELVATSLAWLGEAVA